jgi:23S rRNA-intervening sequence protein
MLSRARCAGHPVRFALTCGKLGPNGDTRLISQGKLTDCDGENAETDPSLDFAKDSGYIAFDEHAEMTALCAEIGKMLGAMMKNPTDAFLDLPASMLLLENDFCSLISVV